MFFCAANVRTIERKLSQTVSQLIVQSFNLTNTVPSGVETSLVKSLESDLEKKTVYNFFFLTASLCYHASIKYDVLLDQHCWSYSPRVLCGMLKLKLACQSSNDILLNWLLEWVVPNELLCFTQRIQGIKEVLFFFYNNSQFYSSHRLHLTLRVKWKWSKEFTLRRDSSDLTVAIKDYILVFNSVNLTQSHRMLFTFESHCFYWALGSRLISPTCGEPFRTFLFLSHLHWGLYQLKYYSIVSEGEVRSGECYFWRQT